MSSSYQSIPLSDRDAIAPRRRTSPSIVRWALALAVVLGLMLGCFNSRFSAAQSPSFREWTPKQVEQWRSMSAHSLCSSMLSSPHCKVNTDHPICALCAETLGEMRTPLLPCTHLQDTQYCSLPPESFSAPACSRCKLHAREEELPESSLEPDDELLPSPEAPSPDAQHVARWNFLSLCQRLKDTEAFCLEETLDSELCQPCSFCAYLKDQHKCEGNDLMVECVECGLAK